MVDEGLHSDLGRASLIVTDWHRSVCDGDATRARGFWTEFGVVVNAAGLARAAGHYADRAPDHCSPSCPAARGCTAVGSFRRFDRDLLSLGLTLGTTPQRPEGCPMWSGTYVMLRSGGDWRIHLFAPGH